MTAATADRRPPHVAPARVERHDERQHAPQRHGRHDVAARERRAVARHHLVEVGPLAVDGRLQHRLEQRLAVRRHDHGDGHRPAAAPGREPTSVPNRQDGDGGAEAREPQEQVVEQGSCGASWTQRVIGSSHVSSSCDPATEALTASARNTPAGGQQRARVRRAGPTTASPAGRRGRRRPRTSSLGRGGHGLSAAKSPRASIAPWGLNTAPVRAPGISRTARRSRSACGKRAGGGATRHPVAVAGHPGGTPATPASGPARRRAPSPIGRQNDPPSTSRRAMASGPAARGPSGATQTTASSASAWRDAEGVEVGELPGRDVGAGGDAALDEVGARRAERAVAVEQEHRLRPRGSARRSRGREGRRRPVPGGRVGVTSFAMPPFCRDVASVR